MSYAKSMIVRVVFVCVFLGSFNFINNSCYSMLLFPVKRVYISFEGAVYLFSIKIFVVHVYILV